MTVQLSICIALLFLLTIIVCRFYFTRKTRLKVSYMLDALEDGETNFRFGKGRLFDRAMNETLNRLRDIYDRETMLIREKERYYGQMLDNVQTGIAVVEPKSDRIIYSNRMARSLLGISSMSSMRQLSIIDPTLYEAFVSAGDGVDRKATFHNERGQCCISVSASFDHIDNKEVKIMVFNDISSTLEEVESESWSRLIRVLTHEIMNTVTPIAALSEALHDVSGEELQAGLETISSSARSLIHFVESYRNLSRVAAPVRKAFYVKEIADDVIELSEPFVSQSGTITIYYEEKADDILLYADRGQIFQILINLVKNAVQAGAKKVIISAGMDSGDRVYINVENDGPAIIPEKREEIFVPFYTTKPEGTGIGLSLSRQIMRLHGGNLRLVKSDATGTVFSLTFP